MVFIGLSSDPNSAATEKDFANTVFRHEFTPGVENKGGSAKSYKIFAAYQVQFLKATQFASAKANANRHLASSSHGTCNNGFATRGYSSTPPNPKSKTQQKKIAAADKKPIAGSEDKAGEAREFKGKAKAYPIRE